ncbi:MAG: hypothetical protein OXF79_24400 [Chloroflexi bacterium]|nr:hypothetical protein [Chloroflexota bacterium]
MSIVEALWAVHFGDAYTPSQPNGGVAILETSRIFGGDSQFYYVGKYEVTGEKLTAQVRIAHFSGPNMTAFGLPLACPLELKLEGRRNGDMINGRMWPISQPDLNLPVSLKRLEDLP